MYIYVQMFNVPLPHNLPRQICFSSHPPNLYRHLLSCSHPKPGSQLLFHSHIQSTYIQFILLPTLIICNPDHSNRLGLTASILALANPFSTQQPAMLKQNRSCCSHKILQSLPTTFIVKSYTSLLIELWTYQCLASLPSHMFF